MPKPRLDPTPANETAHILSQDLVGRIKELLSDQTSPDDANWTQRC